MTKGEMYFDPILHRILNTLEATLIKSPGLPTTMKCSINLAYVIIKRHQEDVYFKIIWMNYDKIFFCMY